VNGSDFPSFDEAFFPLAVAERPFDDLVFDRAFLGYDGVGFYRSRKFHNASMGS